VAILKHGSIKNSDYGAAQLYLLFEHDEHTQKLLRDADGLMIPRSGIIQTALNCDAFTFNTECTELNRALGKNLCRDDVKTHHYIISFDPKDVTENGLTAQRAHDIGVEFAKKFFAGHQTLIVTHPDGHKKSGNMHVHIVLNSLRKENITWQSFMERQTDVLAGYKHHQTRDLLTHMQDTLNEICTREKLNVVDFTVPADRKVTDREYQETTHSGSPSVKDEIRKAVDAAVKKAKSIDELKRFLRDEYNIEVKETRGVWSYIHPRRTKPIRGRSLGRLYEKETVIDRIKGIPLEDNSRPEYKTLPRIFLIHSDLKLVVDIQNCVKAQQSRTYARKVAISNLQQIARSVVFLQNNGISSREELESIYKKQEEQYQEASAALLEIKSKIKVNNESIHYLGRYLSTKSVYAQFTRSTDKNLFRNAHRAEIDKHEDSREHLQAMYSSSVFPGMSELKREKGRLRQTVNGKNREKQKMFNELKRTKTVMKNLELLFRDIPSLNTTNRVL